jgi:K+-sensing histidine kinase KdpD
VAALESQASAKGVSLAAELPDKLPPVNIDSHRIIQVLRNLLENAVAHTAKDGAITVAASHSPFLSRKSLLRLPPPDDENNQGNSQSGADADLFE